MISSFVFLLQSRTFNQERTYIKKEITKLSAHYEENDSKIAQGMGNKMWKNVSYKQKKIYIIPFKQQTTKKIAKKSEKRVDNEDRGVIY